MSARHQKKKTKGLPKKVQIGALEYSVELADVIEKGEFIGLHQPVEKKILLFSKMNDKTTLNILLHEICHAMFYERNLGDYIGRDKEEHVVDQLGNALHSLLINNKELRRYIDAVCES